MSRPERLPIKQKLPDDLVATLLSLIRRQFVPDISTDEWFKVHNHFIKRNVVLWPARFMVGKGFTISLDRYEAAIMEVLQEIKRHGQTATVRYWPGYLMHCVQEHFKHHWEDYYAEAKRMGNLADKAVLAMAQRKGDPGDNGMLVLAMAHRVLTAGKRRPAKAAPAQGEFLL